MKSVAVYCGSSPGRDRAFIDAASELGTLLAERGLIVVYGGARVGTMGVLADAALAAGGTVHGVITRQLVDIEVAHDGLTRLDVVDSMHERKARMALLADAVITLPGGLGTLDELFEMLTWSQLGLHHKPIGLLDVDGFWAPLLTFLDQTVDAGFVRPEHRRLVLCHDDPATLIGMLESWQPPDAAKWVNA